MLEGVSLVYAERQGGLQNGKYAGNEADFVGRQEHKSVQNGLGNAERAESDKHGGKRRCRLNVAQPRKNGYPACKGAHGRKAG